MKSASYWLDTAPEFDAAPTEPVAGRVDAAIIGGGLTGLSAAVALGRKGASVALFEKDTVGFSASGRNGGMCTPGMVMDFGAAVRRFGAARAREMHLSYNAAIDLVERLIAEEGIDCDFRRTGKLTLASKPHHYDRLVRRRDALAEHADYETNLVPPSDIRSEVGSATFHGGLVDPLGAGFHVGKFVRGLARAATGLGVRIYEGTPVTGLVRTGGCEHEVTTPKGSLGAEAVLLATGSTTGSQFGWFRRRIIPVGSFIIVTEPLSRSAVDALLPTRRMASDSRNISHYFRITPDDRLLFGGRARFAMSDAASDLRSGRILERNMAAMFPELAGARIDYCWGGLVDMTVDRLPRAGERNGLFYAMGYSGHGTQMSTYMGSQMVEVMDGSAEANAWRGSNWTAVPGHFGPPWFLPLVGMYYRLKDAVD